MGGTAVFFETPKWTKNNLSDLLKFSLTNASDTFSGEPSIEKFSEHLKDCKSDSKGSISFPNPNKTSRLIIPCPQCLNKFGHLGHFIKYSDDETWSKLWKKVAEELEKQIKPPSKGVWLSTHGLGVPWLHIRIDTTPKYYKTESFKGQYGFK